MSVRLVSVGPIYPTRFPGLNYQRIGRDWRMLDASTGATIEAIYPTRGELLSDLPRVAKARGLDERGA
jgi:hypothetical protein